MTNKYVYLADIDADIDDTISAEWLQRNNLLECLVLDGKSRNQTNEKRLQEIGVVIKSSIPTDTKILLCGGALTKVREFIEDGGSLDWLIMNGGFAGSNVVNSEDVLPKFKFKDMVRTFNFNMDIESTLYVLNSPQVKNIMLVSKNVCHSERNTILDLHKNDREWITSRYNIRDDKRLHDLLMVKEGIHMLEGYQTLLEYDNVDMLHHRSAGKDDNMTVWGSTLNSKSKIKISTGMPKKR